MALLVTGIFPVPSLPFQSEPPRECCHSRLSENVLNKPLDSGLRRNDGGGRGQAFIRYGKGAVGMAIHLLFPRRHSSAGSPTGM